MLIIIYNAMNSQLAKNSKKTTILKAKICNKKTVFFKKCSSFSTCINGLVQWRIPVFLKREGASWIHIKKYIKISIIFNLKVL